MMQCLKGAWTAEFLAEKDLVIEYVADAASGAVDARLSSMLRLHVPVGFSGEVKRSHRVR